MTYDLSKAMRIGEEAHKNQRSMYSEFKRFFDEHPFRVMKLTRKSLHWDKTKYSMVALLHDVVEDTEWTLEDLRKEEVPEDVIEAVDLLTHRKDEDTYFEYLDKLKDNEVARQVKLADMITNLTFFFIHNKPNKMKKYLDGINYLISD